MKKTFFLLALGFFAMLFACVAYAVRGTCSPNVTDKDFGANFSVQQAVQECEPQYWVTSKQGYGVKWVRGKIVEIANQLIIAGSILSVWGIVFAAILYVISAWDGEKVKKAKTALKFSIVGFIVMLLSFPLVNAIVNLIYGLG